MTFDPFTNQQETYRVDIFDPKDVGTDGSKKPGAESVGWVELRTLTAGDRAEFNELKIVEDESASIPTGRIQILQVERAIVSWSFEHPPTRDTISVLRIEVFDQILRAIGDGNPSLAEEVGLAGRGPLESPETTTAGAEPRENAVAIS